jgi:cobalamin synthase
MNRKHRHHPKGIIMLRHTWLAPFMLLAVLLAIYLYAPAARREALQKRIREDINFHLIADLILVVFAVSSTLLYRQGWLRYATWVALAMAVVACTRRVFAQPPPPPPSAFDDDAPGRL